MTIIAIAEIAGAHIPPGLRELALAFSLTPIAAAYYWWQMEKHRYSF